MKLVVVESPTKAKTLSSILGGEYIIKASNGHVRDLPKSGLGVDIEHDFAPEYIISSKSKKVVGDLKKSLEGVDGVVLATDLDREGEAIAWHLREILSGDGAGKKLEYTRAVFHEITKEAVSAAFSHQSELNENLFDAQQARRVLDRLVGYKLSPLLWKKVRYGLSAGRVQSVAVRLIVERERERQAFESQEYWSIEGEFENKDKDKERFAAELVEKDGEKLEIKTEADAKRIEADLRPQGSRGGYLKVAAVKRSEKQRKPYAPFKTSTLQQSAANSFGFSAKRTMDAAQRLFEEGFITYHRTDSLNLSAKFVGEARAYISKTLGQRYLPNKPVFYKTSSKGAQEAHEAIRPTSAGLAPDELSTRVGGDELKVYSLIWKRSLECQMLPAVYDQTLAKIVSGDGYGFRANGSVMKFDGWLAVGRLLGIKEEGEALVELGHIQEGDSVALLNLSSQQHFTQPPARYTDATLIKEMEELGVGRPSTYAPTIATIQARKYVEKDGRYFAPTDVAMVVTGLLEKHFPAIVDYEFTAEMEEKLDGIAEGARKWIPVVREFYEPFEKNLLQKETELKKADMTTLGQSGEACPRCGRVLNIKLGKYGKFLSCSGYPECDFAKPIGDDGGESEKDFGACEKCGEGKMVIKQGRFGKFLACNNYPKCKNTKLYLDKIGLKCPKCGEGEVVVKSAKRGQFFGCSRYPDCNYASWKNPLQVFA